MTVKRVASEDVPRIGNNGTFNGGDRFDVELTSGAILVHEGQTVEAKFITGPSRSADDVGLSIIAPKFRTLRVPINYDGLDINLGMQFGDSDSIEVLQALQQKLNFVITQDKDRRNHYHLNQYYDWILSGNRVGLD